MNTTYPVLYVRTMFVQVNTYTHTNLLVRLDRAYSELGSKQLKSFLTQRRVNNLHGWMLSQSESWYACILSGSDVSLPNVSQPAWALSIQNHGM
jgi:hypothetical protein